MELGVAGLKEQPFRTHGKPLVFVHYAGQQAALDFLQSTYQNPHGLGLFLGPALSGKTTILRHFVEHQDPEVAVAIVDGARLNTTSLLEAILGQFGYRLEYNSANELINMLKVFTMQQAASGRPPLLIIERTQAMNPSALRVLCELANIKVRHASAMRMVFASDRPINSIIEAPAMQCIADRLTGEFRLGPLDRSEIADYLFAKLYAGGCEDPSVLMPRTICYELHKASGGWPGIADRVALLAIAKATSSPIGKKHLEYPTIPDHSNAAPFHLLPDDVASQSGKSNIESDEVIDASPRIYLSLNGETLSELVLDGPRALIGRSEHNEVSIESRFISRHHAMFIRHGSVTFLMDLNSTNGTFVNSRKVSNHVMMHNDVITMGNHSIKFEHPTSSVRSETDATPLPDTVIMKTLDDMRRMLAQENTHTMPMHGNDLVASGDKEK